MSQESSVHWSLLNIPKNVGTFDPFNQFKFVLILDLVGCGCSATVQIVETRFFSELRRHPWCWSLPRATRMRFRRDVKNESFAEVLSAWKSSLPPTTGTLESLITAQIVENPEPTYYDSHYRGARGNNSMGPDHIKRLRNSLSWLKRPRETLHAERTKSRFHFTVLHLGTGAEIC